MTSHTRFQRCAAAVRPEPGHAERGCCGGQAGRKSPYHHGRPTGCGRRRQSQGRGEAARPRRQRVRGFGPAAGGFSHIRLGARRRGGCGRQRHHSALQPAVAPRADEARKVCAVSGRDVAAPQTRETAAATAGQSSNGWRGRWSKADTLLAAAAARCPLDINKMTSFPNHARVYVIHLSSFFLGLHSSDGILSGSCGDGGQYDGKVLMHRGCTSRIPLVAAQSPATAHSCPF